MKAFISETVLIESRMFGLEVLRGVWVSAMTHSGSMVTGEGWLLDLEAVAAGNNETPGPRPFRRAAECSWSW